jgi:hypothetical protein
MPWLTRQRSPASAGGPPPAGRFGLRPSPAKRRAALMAGAALSMAVAAALLAQLPAAEAWRDSLLAAATAGGAAAAVALLSWLLIPGLSRLTREELARRRQLFSVAYRDGLADPTVDSIADLRVTQTELELTDEEIGPERAEVIRAPVDLFALDEQLHANGGELPPAAGYAAVASPERCVLASEALLRHAGMPERGHVLFTRAYLALRGATETRICWSEVRSFRRDGASLIVQATPDGMATRITLPTVAEAMRAEFIAGALRATVPGAAVV